MTKQEQHDLLIRLDERTNNIWRVVEKVERHQTEQNGLIGKAIKEIGKNTQFRQISIKVLTRCVLPLIGAIILAWLGIQIPHWL